VETVDPDIVCLFGSRKFPKAFYELMDQYVDGLPRDTIVVVGGAPGPDLHCEARARARGLTVERYDADWTKGKGAGFARNTTMVERSKRGVAFWDGHSSGTLDTIKKFRAADKPIAVIERQSKNLYP